MSNKNNNQNRQLLDQQRTQANTQYQPFLQQLSGYTGGASNGRSSSSATPRNSSGASSRGGTGNPSFLGNGSVPEGSARTFDGGSRTPNDAVQTPGIGDFGQGQNDELRSQIRDTYSNPDSFSPAGMRPNAQGWFDLPGGEDSGGSSAGGDFSQAKGGYSDFANTGGINRADWDKAKSGYDEFASGGGVNATALRQRATAQIPSFYDQYKQSAARRSNVQGGYSPGFDAQQAEIGRQAGREGFNASRQVEGDIADKVQQGRMFGISGQGSLASNIAGMEQSGRLAGLGGLTSIGGMEQQNSQFNAGLGESRAGRNQAAQMDAARMYQQNRQFGASGLSDLYGTGVNDTANRRSQYGAGLSGLYGNQLQNIGARSSIQDRDLWDRLAQGAGAAGGVATAIGGG